METVRTF